MANLLWGKVFYHQLFVGILREEPGGLCSFSYDGDYLDRLDAKPIAVTLPLQREPHFSHNGLPPFFNNLVAEGWLERAQSRALGKREVTRFELLLAFGFDCAGAVSVIDPDPSPLTHSLIEAHEDKTIAVLTSKASLSGIQPKLAIIEKDKKFYPSKTNELSTHIAKFPSQTFPSLLENEYLTTLAFKALVPQDEAVSLEFRTIEGINEQALVIKRFDRHNGKRLHFEEFNQILGLKPSRKYSGSYGECVNYFNTHPQCLPVEGYKFFNRVLAGILLGNTDMHLKNFALFHQPTGLRLTPHYDNVCSSLYDYKSLALEFAGVKDLILGQVKPKHLILFQKETGMAEESVTLTLKQFSKTKEAAKEAIYKADFGKAQIKETLIKSLEQRWNGIFASIGKI